LYSVAVTVFTVVVTENDHSVHSVCSREPRTVS